jgi:hypothetical protein
MERMGEEWDRFEPFSGMVELAHHFLMCHPQWEETDDLKEVLRDVWSENENDDDYIALISPLFLLINSRAPNWDNSDCEFLSVICDGLVTQENDWDYPLMIQDLLKIYESVDFWDIQTTQFCHLLVTYLGKGIEELERLGFADALLEKMTDIVREFIEADATLLQYLLEQCEEDDPLIAWIEEHFGLGIE